MSRIAEWRQGVAALGLSLALGASTPATSVGAQTAPVDDVRVVVPGRAGQAVQGAPTPAGRVGPEQMLPVVRGDNAEVISVGGVAIRASDVFRELDLVVPGTAADIVRQMVLSAMARGEALALGIDVPADRLADEVSAAIAEQRARFAIESSDQVTLETYVQSRFGFDAERYREEIRTRVLASMLLERAVRFQLGAIERDQLQIILVQDEALAQEIAAKLREGASFAVLAKRHSVHPSGPQGGDLPDVPADAELPLVEGRRSLQPGEILGPAPITLEGQRFYRVLRLVDRIPADLRDWSARAEQIEAGLVARPLRPDELTLFEARMMDRYRVTRPGVQAR